MTDYEIEQAYADMLDEVYGTVIIAGTEFETSRALRELDPIMYNEGLLDFTDSLQEDSEWHHQQCTHTHAQSVEIQG